MAVSYDTWAELQTAIEAWTTVDVSDAQVQEFIGLAEAHFQRTVFTPDREAALSITADAQVEALPSNFYGFKSPPYIDSAPDVPLSRVNPDVLRAMYPDTSTGTPQHYAIEGTNILFGPTPSSSVTVKGTYYTVITPLSGSATSNWLLLAHPDLYLAGSLAEAFAFHMDEAREAKWIARRDRMIDDINRLGRMRGANSGPLTASAAPPTVRNIAA